MTAIGASPAARTAKSFRYPEAFVRSASSAKAPQNVVEGEREKYKKYESLLLEVRESLDKLK